MVIPQIYNVKVAIDQLKINIAKSSSAYVQVIHTISPFIKKHFVKTGSDGNLFYNCIIPKIANNIVRS